MLASYITIPHPIHPYNPHKTYLLYGLILVYDRILEFNVAETSPDGCLVCTYVKPNWSPQFG